MNIEIEPNRGPKKILVEGFACRILNNMLVVSFGSGEELTAYTIPLPGAKALGRAITKQIEEIEKKTGKTISDINLSDEPVPSPLDFGKPGPQEEPKK